jgi:hypothetical protein
MVGNQVCGLPQPFERGLSQRLERAALPGERLPGEAGLICRPHFAVYARPSLDSSFDLFMR